MDNRLECTGLCTPVSSTRDKESGVNVQRGRQIKSERHGTEHRVYSIRWDEGPVTEEIQAGSEASGE